MLAPVKQERIKPSEKSGVAVPRNVRVGLAVCIFQCSSSGVCRWGRRALLCISRKHWCTSFSVLSCLPHSCWLPTAITCMDPACWYSQLEEKKKAISTKMFKWEFTALGVGGWFESCGCISIIVKNSFLALRRQSMTY